MNKGMSELLVVDSIVRNSDNVTWAMHTSAEAVVLHGQSVVLVSPSGMKMQMQLNTTPPGVCADWRAAQVTLPNGTLHNETRFPLYGAQKVWSVCSSAVSEVQVTLRDL